MLPIIIQRSRRLLKSRFGKRIRFNPEAVVRNNVQWSSFIERLLPVTKAKSINLEGSKDGVLIEIHFENKSLVFYKFKYDKDGLLLLRGAGVKRGMKIKYMISPFSIPDFAILARPLKAEYDKEWIPNHGTINNVAGNISLGLFIDGKLFADIDDFKLTDVSNIKIVQTFDAYNANDPSIRMWEHSVKHEIDLSNPYCEISNSIKIDNDTEIEKMYLTMLPSSSSNASGLLLDNGKEFTEIATDGSEFNTESKISSAMYLSASKNGNMDVAAVDTDKESPAIITFRSDDVTKFYLNHFSGITRKGTVFNNKHRIIVLSGIENLNEQLEQSAD